MPEADSHSTPKRHKEPFNNAFRAAVNRLKQIADQSADAMLTEGPVSPDHALLELCAVSLHHLAYAQKAYDARDLNAICYMEKGPARTAAEAEDHRLLAAYYEGERQGKLPLARIAKMKATSAAGIYAKAMIVRASRTGAARLAASLAEDLLDCPGLRAAIWPAGEV